MGKIRIDIKNSNGESSRGYLLDISNGGACVASLVSINKNADIELWIEEGGLVILKGKVVRVDEKNSTSYRHEFGVKFYSSDKSNQKSIRDFLDRKEKRGASRLPLM